jgi:uncharacterized protein YbaR (Trm112 family)
MTLRKELLEILCCPMCKGELAYDAAAATLTCQACKLVFPIKDGIPMMRPEDGVPLRKDDAR